MKTSLKTIAVAAAIALAVAVMPANTYARDYRARDNGWNTAVAVLAGVAVVGTIAAIASQHDHDRGYSRPDYGPPPPACEPVRQWIPGHYEVQRERVCLPGYWDTVVTPAEYGWVRQGYRSCYVMIRPACTRRVWVPERTEWQETNLWVPGHYEVGSYAYAR